MNVKSLGYRTDLIFSRFSGQVQNREHYLVISTPTNPTFWYGNYLLFESPPGPDDVTRWEALFVESFPAAEHRVFGWDGVDGAKGAADLFLPLGYELNETVVLTASALVAPQHFNDQAQYRPLSTPEDWEQNFAFGMACNDEYEPTSHAPYLRQRIAEYRHMSEAGLGHIWGAFYDDQMVACLGLYFQGGTARFQNVETHPEFRRQGLCASLVTVAATQALTRGDAQVLVMAADEQYHAARIYQRLGFKEAERQIAIQRPPSAAFL